jgi:hypothetical protein
MRVKSVVKKKGDVNRNPYEDTIVIIINNATVWLAMDGQSIISFLDSAEILIWQPRFSSVLISNTRGGVAGPVLFDNNKSWEKR